ncbi:MAG: hypothetical protein FWG02_10925 [Holophagaceae bacterium]|nr:hypothetical protein [Holophagaceae bacterium]
MTNCSGIQKPFGFIRCISVLLRSVHIVAMAIVLGGVFLNADHQTLSTAIWATVLSGILMFISDIIKSPRVLLQGSGIMVLLKLILLAVGFFALPQQRFYWYLGATFLASIGSHMPGTLRHCVILKGGVGRK